jgi:hypothetical protein
VIAICLGVAATLAWQAYGDAFKQMVATKAPELAWSPEIRQQIAAWVQQLGWAKPTEAESTASETTAAATTAPAASQPASVTDSNPGVVAPQQPAADLSPLLDQVQQIAADLAALKQDLAQLSTNEDETAHEVAKLQATSQDILNRVGPPLPQVAAIPAHKHLPAPPPAARPPTPLH